MHCMTVLLDTNSPATDVKSYCVLYIKKVESHYQEEASLLAGGVCDLSSLVTCFLSVEGVL